MSKVYKLLKMFENTYVIYNDQGEPVNKIAATSLHNAIEIAQTQIENDKSLWHVNKYRHIKDPNSDKLHYLNKPCGEC